MIKESVINAFNRYYEEALTKRWIKKKLSWALYQTWQWCDANETERENNGDKGNE